MVALGSMLEDGRGVNGDFRQAHMLYQMASQIGLKSATDALENLKKRLSPQQLQMAEAYTASGGRDNSTPSPGPAPAAPRPRPAFGLTFCACPVRRSNRTTVPP